MELLTFKRQRCLLTATNICIAEETKHKPEPTEKSLPKPLSVAFVAGSETLALLYSSVLFDWFSLKSGIIVVDAPKTGYRLELFFKAFKIKSIFLDPDMPLNSNKHHLKQYTTKRVQLLIVCANNGNSLEKEAIEWQKTKVAVAFLNCFDNEIYDYCSRSNKVSKVLCFYQTINKKKLTDELEEMGIMREEVEFDKVQVSHLKYRTDDAFNSVTTNEIKNVKKLRINSELLNSKKMTEFFEANPQEKQIIKEEITKCKQGGNRNSLAFVPNYLIHDKKKESLMEKVIEKEYSKKTGRRRKGGKIEKYLENVEKNDGSHLEIKL